MSYYSAINLSDEEAAERLRTITYKVRHSAWHGVPPAVHPSEGQARVEWDELKATIRAIPDLLSRTREYYLRQLKAAPTMTSTPTQALSPLSQGMETSPSHLASRDAKLGAVSPGKPILRSASPRKSTTPVLMNEASSFRLRALRSEAYRRMGQGTGFGQMASHQVNTSAGRSSSPVCGSGLLESTSSPSTSRTAITNDDSIFRPSLSGDLTPSISDPQAHATRSRRSTVKYPTTREAFIRSQTPPLFGPTPRHPINLTSLSRSALTTQFQEQPPRQSATRKSYPTTPPRLHASTRIDSGRDDILHPSQLNVPLPQDTTVSDNQHQAVSSSSLPSYFSPYTTTTATTTHRTHRNDWNHPDQDPLAHSTQSAETYDAWDLEMKEIEDANAYYWPLQHRSADGGNGEASNGESFANLRRENDLTLGEGDGEDSMGGEVLLSDQEIWELLSVESLSGNPAVSRADGAGAAGNGNTGRESWGGM